MDQISDCLYKLSAVQVTILNGEDELISAAAEMKKLQQDSEGAVDPYKFLMERYCKTFDKVRKFKEALKELKTTELDSKFSTTLKNLYQEKCESKVPLEDHGGYKAMMTVLSRTNSANINTQTVPSDENSELTVTQDKRIPVDPITKLLITDPMYHTLCGHKYDRKSIMGYIRSRKENIKCPVAGCGKPLTEDVLEIDEEMYLLINQS